MGSPIENLPVELLVDIFIESQIKDKSPFENVIEECQRPVTNWVPLMLVCRLFRDVIVDVPGLWSRLPVTNNLIALQRRLFRSQVSPLDLLFSVSCESALPFLLPHAPRIRAIVTTPRFHINLLPSLIPLLGRYLPALECVYIVPKMSLDFDSKEWSKLRAVSPVLNEAAHPRVKTVASYQLLLPPKQSGFWSQNLFHLDIRAQYAGIPADIRDDILAVLRATLRLESLAITFPEHALHPDYWVEMAGDTPASFLIHPPREPALLLRLRTFTLVGPAWLSGPVLHDIEAPSPEKLYVQTKGYSRPDTAKTIAAMFPERLRRILAQHTRLHIHAAPSDSRGFRIGDCHCDGGRISSDRLYLRVQDDCGLYSASRVLCQVFGEALLETLEVNYFERQGRDLCGVWKPVLETFPRLRKVTLYGNDQKSGAAMVDAIEGLQREGLNPEMELVMESAPW
ncbi:hypothetical protein LXA43DRAFT_348644 [Ganoderma leucocontextum]|nr:hypothetical protein LXA43DRAFT_348644 [Ganoderma leucocontextum]